MGVSGSGPGLFGVGFQMKQYGYYDYDHSYYITILIVITIIVIITIMIILVFVMPDIRMEEHCKKTLSMLQNAVEPHGTPTKRAPPPRPRMVFAAAGGGCLPKPICGTRGFSARGLEAWAIHYSMDIWM